MALDDIVRRLADHRIKPAGDGRWMAQCPSHADSTPSLSVGRGTGGKALLFCHGGCTTEAVLTALGMELGDLFDGDDRKDAVETQPPERWPVTATYTYQNADGTPRYRVLRKTSQDSGNKTFRQERLIDGKWLPGMESVERVLYHLPRLRDPELADETVFLTEGERDAENLIAIGLLATTNVGGAGKWLPAYSETMRRRHVVVLPDNDEPGEKHAGVVSKALEGVAASVKVLRLPGLPPKGDVSDWVGNGGTAEQLSVMVDRLNAGASFMPSPKRLVGERADRIEARKGLLSFGVKFLDDALGGITRRDLILVGAKTGVGKCLGLGTPVMKFDGSVVPVETVAEGDVLMGADSTPRRVRSTTRGRGKMFRIIPTKGDMWTCNDVHVMTTVHSATGEVTDKPLDEFLQQDKTRQKHGKLFRVGVEFSCGAELPVDPYFVGVVIGDGSVERGGVRVCKPDQEIAAECQRQAERWGLRYRMAQYGEKTPCHFMVGERGVENPLFVALRDLGLEVSCEFKRVPAMYLTAPRADRLQLLAGLIDTDGHLSNNNFDWISASSGLARDVVFLARSLGLAAYMAECRKGCQTGAVGTYYRVCISGHTDGVPTRIPRKRATPRAQIKDVLRTGFVAEPIGEGEYAGFELDGDGRFLLGDFTVTHNTQLALNIAIANCRAGKRVHYFALEAEEREMERRMKFQILAGVYYRHAMSPQRIRYIDWYNGRLDDVLGFFEERADREVAELLKNLNTYYRVDTFTGADFSRQLEAVKDDTDLVVLDHFHYVDSDDDNENRGHKQLVKQIRDCVLRADRPVLVVGHVRKSDPRNAPLVPTEEAFHGSSDIVKIATKAIMIAPDYGTQTGDSSLWATYMQIVKCRQDSSLTRYAARLMYDIRTDSYRPEYSLGRLIDSGKQFELLPPSAEPSWLNTSAEAA